MAVVPRPLRRNRRRGGTTVGPNPCMSLSGGHDVQKLLSARQLRPASSADSAASKSNSWGRTPAAHALRSSIRILVRASPGSLLSRRRQAHAGHSASPHLLGDVR